MSIWDDARKTAQSAETFSQIDYLRHLKSKCVDIQSIRAHDNRTDEGKKTLTHAMQELRTHIIEGKAAAKSLPEFDQNLLDDTIRRFVATAGIHVNNQGLPDENSDADCSTVEWDFRESLPSFAKIITGEPEWRLLQCVVRAVQIPPEVKVIGLAERIKEKDYVIFQGSHGGAYMTKPIDLFFGQDMISNALHNGYKEISAELFAARADVLHDRFEDFGIVKMTNALPPPPPSPERQQTQSWNFR
ncbi:unnamed protein product [Sphagnum tenellum]